MKEMRAFPRLSLACDIEYSLSIPGILASQEKIVSKTKLNPGLVRNEGLKYQPEV